MAGRTRTTKKLAQRIDRNYFKHVFPISRWRRILSLSLAALGVLWLAWHAFARDERVYSSGPMTTAHTMIGANCTACHAQNAALSKAVTDQACKGCHDGPIHRAQETFSPSCGSCHLEHQGAVQLTRMSDQACTQCHSNLKTKDGHLNVAATVTSFAHGHPEFRPVRGGAADPGTIKFNHKVHLASSIRGPAGNVHLECVDCHRRAGDQQAWKYGGPTLLNAVATTQPGRINSTAAGGYMAPVRYDQACSSCHPLRFDQHIAEPAPHSQADLVHAFITKAFKDYIAGHPQELRAEAGLAPRIPRQPLEAVPHTAAQWVDWRVNQAEQLLWDKTCKECHTLKFVGGAPIPQVGKANVTTRWLTRGEFDHSAHQMVVCTSCHTNARSSTVASDVLIPGMNVCRECHQVGQNRASAQCTECHNYHDWSKEKPIEGKFTVRQLLSASAPRWHESNVK